MYVSCGSTTGCDAGHVPSALPNRTYADGACAPDMVTPSQHLANGSVIWSPEPPHDAGMLFATALGLLPHRQFAGCAYGFVFAGLPDTNRSSDGNTRIACVAVAACAAR